MMKGWGANGYFRIFEVSDGGGVSKHRSRRISL